MTWPLSGWLFSSSSSSSIDEHHEDSQLNDEDSDSDEITFNHHHADAESSLQEDAGNNGQFAGLLNSSFFSPDDDNIPTAIAISCTGNAPNNVVTIAVPGSDAGVFDGTKQQSLHRRATVWTNEDELELLRGYQEFVSRNRISGHRLPRQEISTFYHIIKPKIHFPCDKNQIIEKLRRLKRKFQTVSSRIGSSDRTTFRSPRDRSIFEISREIWGRNSGKSQPEYDNTIRGITDSNFKSKVKRESPIDEFEERDDPQPSKKRHRTRLPSGEASDTKEMPGRENGNIDDIDKISGLVEGVTRGCLTPFLKELMNSASPPNWLIGRTGRSGGREAVEERWRKQEAMEMEVYVKRLELVQEEIRVALKDMKSREERRL